MKYSMVRQFSNNAIDNGYKFFYKIYDFGKVFIDMILAFFDIWYTFFMIFYNIFGYFYYLFLFLVDSGTETRSPLIFWRKNETRASYIPSVTRIDTPNPIPAMYRATEKVAKTAGAAVSGATNAARATVSTMSTPVGGKARRSFFKSIAEALVEFFDGIKKALTGPFQAIVLFFDRKMKPVKEEDQTLSQGKSLIEEYMKEYATKRK